MERTLYQSKQWQAIGAVALLVLFLACACCNCAEFAFATDTGAKGSAAVQSQASIEEVRASMRALSADPTSYTADDLERVEAVKAAFDSLSTEDQALLDKEESHPQSAQSLGRVLEAALWAVWSYAEVDNSTELPDGVYDKRTIPALSSKYSKGKSTSGRDRPWSVKEVTVKDGKAFATITVASETYPNMWMGGVYYPQANESGNCEFSDIPINLNSTFYFAGVSSSMPLPIAFSLTTSIDEGDVESPINVVKRLIAALPADPDTITEADRPAIEEAAAAYDALSEAEQKELDTTELAKEQTYGRWLESAQWGLQAQLPIDNSLAVVDGDYAQYITSSSSMGKSTSQRARSWSVVKLTVVNGKATAVVRCNTSSAFVNMRVGGVDYKADVIDGVPEFTVPIVVNDIMYFTIDANSVADSIAYQLNTTLPLEPASITEVSAAAAKAASVQADDLSVYEDASAAVITSTANALAQAAAKSGVTEVELNVATAALDSAVAGAVKKPVVEPSKDDPTPYAAATTGNTDSGKNKSKNKNKNKNKTSSSSTTSTTSTSSSTSTTGTSQSQVVPTVSSNRTSTSTSSSTTNQASNATSQSSSTTSSGSSDSSSTTTGSAAAGSGDATADGAPSAAEQETPAPSTPASGDNSPSVSVREVTMSDGDDEKSLGMVLGGGGVVALVLIGMVTRTFLFVRAKDVA